MRVNNLTMESRDCRNQGRLVKCERNFSFLVVFFFLYMIKRSVVVVFYPIKLRSIGIRNSYCIGYLLSGFHFLLSSQKWAIASASYEFTWRMFASYLFLCPGSELIAMLIWMG